DRSREGSSMAWTAELVLGRGRCVAVVGRRLISGVRTGVFVANARDAIGLMWSDRTTACPLSGATVAFGWSAGSVDWSRNAGGGVGRAACCGRYTEGTTGDFGPLD